MRKCHYRGHTLLYENLHTSYICSTTPIFLLGTRYNMYPAYVKLLAYLSRTTRYLTSAGSTADFGVKFQIRSWLQITVSFLVCTSYLSRDDAFLFWLRTIAHPAYGRRQPKTDPREPGTEAAYLIFATTTRQTFWRTLPPTIKVGNKLSYASNTVAVNRSNSPHCFAAFVPTNNVTHDSYTTTIFLTVENRSWKDIL